MAKSLTKSQVITAIADANGLPKKQTGEILDSIVQLAYKNAKNTFTLPGLGKLVLVNRKARMGRNPATGATIKIAAKRVVKFRVAKAAKDEPRTGRSDHARSSPASRMERYSQSYNYPADSGRPAPSQLGCCLHDARSARCPGGRI